MIDKIEKQFEADLESIRIEFEDKINAAIDKFIRAKFGNTLGDKIADDSKIIVEISVRQQGH